MTRGCLRRPFIYYPLPASHVTCVRNVAAFSRRRQLRSQHGLSADNQAFFGITDGIFTNNWWLDPQLRGGHTGHNGYIGHIGRVASHRSHRSHRLRHTVYYTRRIHSLTQVDRRQAVRLGRPRGRSAARCLRGGRLLRTWRPQLQRRPGLSAGDRGRACSRPLARPLFSGLVTRVRRGEGQGAPGGATVRSAVLGGTRRACLPAFLGSVVRRVKSRWLGRVRRAGVGG